MTTINDRLTEFVECAFSTAAEAARLVDINAGALYNITKGGRDPRGVTMQKFGEMGCNLHWLITGEGDMFAATDAGRALRKRLKSGKKGSRRGRGKPATGGKKAAGKRSRTLRMELAPVSAGVPRARNAPKGYELIDLEELVTPNAETCVVMRYNGEGLPMVGIERGDWLIIDRKEKPLTGSLVVGRIRRKPANVYRVELRGKRTFLHDCTTEQETEITGQDHRIDGVIITVRRRFQQEGKERSGEEQNQ